MTDRRSTIFRIIVLAGLAAPLLAACAGDAGADQPLTPILIRDRLVGRTLSGTESGNGFLLRLEPNGIARVNGATAEFGQWRASEAGLCLTWHDGAARCAPVLQTGFARYRVGGMELDAHEQLQRPAVSPGTGPRQWDFGVPSP